MLAKAPSSSKMLFSLYAYPVQIGSELDSTKR
jgi:hypothetical protein